MRLREIDAEHLVYGGGKPGPGGSVNLLLTPLELVHLAALILPPRRYRHRYCGVLAFSTPLRAPVRFRQNSSRQNDEILDHLTGRFWPATACGTPS
ncbi:MAG: hypothetical protein V5B39_17595 [Accumulibacter sp.]|uniref:hypothetical protein n=1 Tax=Accumulibacter sp. TaxID=2053492 RepID=UPI002FC33BDE